MLHAVFSASALAEEELCERLYREVIKGRSSAEFVYDASRAKAIGAGRAALRRASEDSAEIVSRAAAPYYPRFATLKLKDGRTVHFREPKEDGFDVTYPIDAAQMKGALTSSGSSWRGLAFREEKGAWQVSRNGEGGPWQSVDSLVEENAGEIEQITKDEAKGVHGFLRKRDAYTDAPAWWAVERVQAGDIAPASEKIPTREEFARAFPHDIHDLGQRQTVLHLGGKFPSEHLVRSYDPATGRVLLQNEELHHLQASPLVTGEGLDEPVNVLEVLAQRIPVVKYRGQTVKVNLRASDPRTLVLESAPASGGPAPRFPIPENGELVVPEFRRPLRDFRPGEIVELEGRKFEVVSVNDREMGQLVLRHVNQVEVGWEQFKSLARAESGLAPSPEARAATAPRGFWARLFRPERNVGLVGKGAVKKVGSSVKFLDDFEATKKETNLPNLFREIEGGRFPPGTTLEFQLGEEVRKFTLDGKEALYPQSGLHGFLREMTRLDRSGKIGHARITLLSIREPERGAERVVRQESVWKNGVLGRVAYDISPVEGVEDVYRVIGADGEHTVTVRYPKGGARRTRQLEKMGREFVENLPKNHSDANSVILLQDGDYYLKPAAGLASPTTQDAGGNGIRSTSILGKAIRSPSLNYRLGVLWHETGHQIAEKIWGNGHNPSLEYARAAALDGQFVSGYAMTRMPNLLGRNDLVEDFAETVEAYLSSDGGVLVPGLREAYPNRFAFLDRVFQIQENQTARDLILRRNLEAAGLVIGAPVTGGAAAYGLIEYKYGETENSRAKAPRGQGKN